MALTADRDLKRREGIIARYPVAANTKIFRGARTCGNASGYTVPAADQAGYTYRGVAMETVDNTGGNDGDKYVKVYIKGCFTAKKTNPALTDIGQVFYVKDDEYVQAEGDSVNKIAVGVCVDIDVEAGEIWLNEG